MKSQINYRIERAQETFRDAELLYNNGSLNSCINRLYYAVFYAAIALLLKYKTEVKSHNGVKRKISEFAFNEIISKENAKTFSVLSDYRNKGDYDDLFSFSPVTVKQLLVPTKKFIDDIVSIVQSR